MKLNFHSDQFVLISFGSGIEVSNCCARTIKSRFIRGKEKIKVMKFIISIFSRLADCFLLIKIISMRLARMTKAWISGVK